MKKFGLIFVLMIAVVGLFTGCDDKETEARLDEVTTALETMDVEKVYALCDDDTKANISQETIAERMSAVYDVLAVESIDYTDLKRNKDASSDEKTVYDATVTLSGTGWSAELPAQLVFSGSGPGLQRQCFLV